MKKKEEAKMTTDPIAKRIREHSFLRGLTRDHLALLTDCALPAQFKAGQIIFREGEKAKLFYLIAKGKVVLESRAEFGEPVVIDTIGAGDLLGWSWMMPPYKWRFTARAVEPTEAIYFAGTILRDYCIRERSLARLRIAQAAEWSDDEKVTSCAQKHAGDACARRKAETRCSRIAVHGPRARLVGNSEMLKANFVNPTLKDALGCAGSKLGASGFFWARPTLRKELLDSVIEAALPSMPNTCLSRNLARPRSFPR